MKSMLLTFAICALTASAYAFNNVAQPEGCSDPVVADCHHDDPGHGNGDNAGGNSGGHFNNGGGWGHGGGDWGNGHGGFNRAMTCIARDASFRKFTVVGNSRSSREISMRAVNNCRARSYKPTSCRLQGCYYGN